jgi:hypothetical protein
MSKPSTGPLSNPRSKTLKRRAPTVGFRRENAWSAGERPSPIDRMSMMADHIEKTAAELRKVAEAGKPLYDSLTDTQKKEFGPLMREFKPRKRL